MYAVIETGGKQYRVEVGTELEVDLLDAEPGQAITIERVLLVADGETASIGQPLVEDAAVEAEVVRRARGEKLIVFKYGPKTRRRVKKGHRQELTVLRIVDVRLGDKSAAAAAKKASDDAKTERQRLEEAAARQASEDAALAAKLAARTPTTAETTAETKAKTKAETKAKTKAEAKAPGRAKAAKADVEPADAPAPKARRAKPATAGEPTSSEADTSAMSDATGEAADDAAAKPRRTRATKKDE